MCKMKTLFFAYALLFAANVLAQLNPFNAGEAIPDFGQIAEVPGMEPIHPDSTFMISFDVAKPAAAGAINRSIVSAARFINMHTAAGVPEENIQLAVVIHGGAVQDVSRISSNQAQSPVNQGHAALILALQEKGVEFYVCGQSAAYYGVKKADLLPGVKMSLSAMTAHALLQQKGYSLNPF